VGEACSTIIVCFTRQDPATFSELLNFPDADFSLQPAVGTALSIIYDAYQYVGTLVAKTVRVAHKSGAISFTGFASGL
jgi:hypothetical protein